MTFIMTGIGNIMPRIKTSYFAMLSEKNTIESGKQKGKVTRNVHTGLPGSLNSYVHLANRSNILSDLNYSPQIAQNIHQNITRFSAHYICTCTVTQNFMKRRFSTSARNKLVGIFIMYLFTCILSLPCCQSQGLYVPDQGHYDIN